MAGFIRVCSRVRRVNPWSIGSLGCALGVVLFIQGGWVHCNGPSELSCSSGFPVFIEVRPGGCRVHPGLLGYALGVVGFILGRWFHWDAFWGWSGPSGVAALIGVRPWCGQGNRGRWVHCSALWESTASSEVAGFIVVRRAGRQVHPGSLGSLGCALGVVVFMRGR